MLGLSHNLLPHADKYSIFHKKRVSSFVSTWKVHTIQCLYDNQFNNMRNSLLIHSVLYLPLPPHTYNLHHIQLDWTAAVVVSKWICWFDIKKLVSSRLTSGMGSLLLALFLQLTWSYHKFFVCNNSSTCTDRYLYDLN